MKTDRLDVHITTDQKELIKYAAEISGKNNISKFISDIILNESKKIITEHNEIQKILNDRKTFCNILYITDNN